MSPSSDRIRPFLDIERPALFSGLPRRSRGLRLAMGLMDILATLIAFLLAQGIYLSKWVEPIRYRSVWDPTTFLWVGLFAGCLLVVIQAWSGLYGRESSLLNIEEDAVFLRGYLLTAVIAMAFSFAIRDLPVSRIALAIALVLTPVCALLGRRILWGVSAHLARRGIGWENVLIYGAGETGRRLAYRILRDPGMGFHPLGFLDDDPSLQGSELRIGSEGAYSLPVLGGRIALREAISDRSARTLLVAIPSLPMERILEIQEACRAAGIACCHVPPLHGASIQRFDLMLIGDVPLLSERVIALAGLPHLVKRAFDVVVSFGLLLALSPLLLLSAILIRLSSAGPVFFIQQRAGQGGAIFPMIKFRSMNVQAPAYAEKQAVVKTDAIFPVGRLLRRASIDELPQLFNVLRGDMSLVGPRPEMPQVVAGYDAFQRERLEVKPGITGLWQVSTGRNAPIHENLDYDLYYIYNWSFLLDVVILFRTVFCLFSGR